MNNQQTNKLFQGMIDLLELPDSAYETAVSRYKDIGKWLCRNESRTSEFDPRIFPQGSFRLGTAIRPLDENEAYDLDLVCEMNTGIAKESRTQESLKRLVGGEIEAYRVSRGIKQPLEEKHRCWQLEYADEISFHMDVLPCISELRIRRQQIREAMIKAGSTPDIAAGLSELTISITDDRHPGYRSICEDWYISNPDGYAQWFEAKMRLAQQFLQERAGIFNAASIDEVPAYRWKAPLQRVVQLLKRHRDQMFNDNLDVKPISIIITTLAAQAYQGEADIQAALRNILTRMEALVNTKTPRVPNPVDPQEDFADRWARADSQHLRLEENFWRWLQQVKVDFELLGDANNTELITEQAAQKFSLNMNQETLNTHLGLGLTSTVVPNVHVVTGQAAKPWCMEE